MMFKKGGIMKKIKKIFLSALPIIIGVGIGFLGSYFGIYKAFEVLFDNIIYNIVFLVLSLAVSVLIAILFHELGHLIAGLLSGYGFLSYRVGSFVLVKYSTGYELKRYSIPGTAGQCLMTPPKYNNGNFPFILYNSGGWIMNLVLGGIGILIYTLSENPFLRYFLIIFIAIQILAALSNAIPLSMGVPNDGKNIQILKNNLEAREGFWSMLQVNALLTEGMEYKDIPEKYLKDPKELTILTIYYPLYRAMALLQRGEYEQAYELQKELMKHPEALTVNEIILRYDLLSTKILLSDDRESLKTEIDSCLTKDFYKMDKIFKTFLNRNRFWILYYKYVEIDPKKEEEYQKNFNKICETNPNKGEVVSERKILEKTMK